MLSKNQITKIRVFISLVIFMTVVGVTAVSAAIGKSKSPVEQYTIHLPLLTQANPEYPAERTALMALYINTNGDGWYSNYGWGTDAPYCTWYGVSCDGYGHVSSIDLYWNALTGILPPEIGDLANLQLLNLGANELTHLPPEIGNLTNLEWLYLLENQFSSLPTEIGNLINLQVLWLGYNQLSSLPTEIGNLANLRVISLYSNKLSSLPPQIENLDNLQTLQLDYNELSDPIPAALSNLSNLYALSLSNNPDLTCWETQAALDWALTLDYYGGPTNVCVP